MLLSRLIALTFIITLCLYAVFLYTKPVSTGQQRKSDPIRIDTAPQAESTLSFSPSPLMLNDFSEHEVTIALDSGTNQLASAQIEMKYDPTKVTILAIRPGEFFSGALVPVIELGQRPGRAAFALSLPEGHLPEIGSGSLAVLTLRRNPTASASAETTIELLPKTSVRGKTTTTSLLKTTESATIILKGIQPPTPTL